MSNKILLIDDEVAFCELCALWLEQAGYQVKFCHDIDTAKGLFDSAKKHQPFNLIIHDLALPPSFRPEDGLAAISHYQDVPVLVLTGHDNRSLALKAIELGAWDFISKPIDPDLLKLIIQRTLEKNSLLQQVKNLEQQLQQSPHDDNIGLVGTSSTIQSTRELIHRISATQVAVLIQGPSGTGKEIIANAIHRLSDRKDQAFISLHCGAIPAELLESELFGYKKGAFTGANSDRKGLLASADKGTLFLDEIGEMPLAMQVKLLRVLQEGSYYPVGSRQLETINIRLISATNRNLPQDILNALFREDLYYRIKGLTIITTSLATRKEDIPVLVQHFLQQHNLIRNVQQQSQLSIDHDASQWFMDTSWPGNIRELKNTLESAAEICLNDHISLQEIELIRGDKVADRISENGDSRSLEEQVRQLEITLISQALTKHKGNKTHSAQTLGITRQGLINKIKRYQLE